MKATGIVRKVDGLGRIVIPKEIRKTMKLEVGQAVEIFVDGSDIILRRYHPGCQICESMEGIEINQVGDKEFRICSTCIDEIFGKMEVPFEDLLDR